MTDIKWMRGYDPDHGDEMRYGDLPVKPLSVITGQVSGNNVTTEIGKIPAKDGDAKLLFAIIDIQASGETATADGDITIVDSSSTTIFTSTGASSEGPDLVNPADGEEVITVDEVLSAVTADNSNADVVAEVTVAYALA